MIQIVFQSILSEVNSYLQAIGRTIPVVEIAPVISKDLSTSSTTKACLSLVNIVEEKIFKSNVNYEKKSNNQIQYQNPDLKFELYGLFSLLFPERDYSSALGYLSDIISFFQGKNVFNQTNTPTLDDSIKSIILHVQTMSFEEQNHLWSVLGARYLPSVLYKINTICIQNENVLNEQKSIEHITLQGHPIGG